MKAPTNLKRFYEQNKDTDFYYFSLYLSKNSSSIKVVRPDYYPDKILWYFPSNSRSARECPKFNTDWKNVYKTREDAIKGLKKYLRKSKKVPSNG